MHVKFRPLFDRGKIFVKIRTDHSPAGGITMKVADEKDLTMGLSDQKIVLIQSVSINRFDSSFLYFHITYARSPRTIIFVRQCATLRKHVVHIHTS